MSIVDEMRKLLDEHGVRYDERDVDNTHVFDIDYFEECGDYLRHVFVTGECVSVETCYLAPEQAIAATLGTETCHDVAEPPKTTAFWPSPHFKCSMCGHQHVSMSYVRYCPNCGRRVVDV